MLDFASRRITGKATSSSVLVGAWAIPRAKSRLVRTYPSPFDNISIYPLNSSAWTIRNNSLTERSNAVEICVNVIGKLFRAMSSRISRPFSKAGARYLRSVSSVGMSSTGIFGTGIIFDTASRNCGPLFCESLICKLIQSPGGIFPARRWTEVGSHSVANPPIEVFIIYEKDEKRCYFFTFAFHFYWCKFDLLR